ncbi:major histocompatibility complex class I-related gene protein-like [Pelmatolapia mariae]|uniref:major histocompatibility complex class I-related gene protein-like n=1 Tax=Pelmatolapia mariae TaxID=158779 RepID=UPI003211E7A4
MGSYNINMKTLEPQQDWVREFIKDDPREWETYSKNCMNYQQILIDETRIFKQHSNEIEGAHLIQQILGCEWDDETEKINGFNLFGYNGEDFIAFDLETGTWITSNVEAEITKQKWNGNIAKNSLLKYFLKNMCPDGMKIPLNYAKHFLNRKVPPSVSLLQKTPSSPVSCHATGFYPNRAVMFWRKDGEAIHEYVDHKEILSNHDGTFQMRVDLNISSVTPEDWCRYDCVFQLSDSEDDIITRLNKSVIRTNWRKTELRNEGEKSVSQLTHAGDCLQGGCPVTSCLK